MKLHITFVIFSLGPGGAERVLTNMANYWAARGLKVTVITLAGNQEPAFYPIHQHVHQIGLEVTQTSKSILHAIYHNLVRVRRLRLTLAKIHPDAVISFMNTTNVLTLLASPGVGFPVIISDRTDIRKHSIGTVWSFLVNCTYPLARFLILQTQEFVNAYPVRLRKNIRVIPNPVFEPFEDAAAESHPLKRPAIISVGRLTYEKGMDTLIKAFQPITSRHPDWQLVIVGDGPLRPELEALCERVGIRNSVIFIGQVNDPYVYLRQADLFVLASRFEGFPNALCEAMACAVPAIATRCSSAIDEIIEAGINGLIVPPESPEKLSEAMEQLILNAEKRRLLGVRAGDIVERFNVDKIMGMWEAVLSEASQYTV